MRHFPIFLKVTGKRVLVSGGGECAIAKLRLLLKTEAEVVVFSQNPEPLVESWAEQGAITLTRRDIRADDFYNAALCYAADDDEELDA
ncbi:MAG: NAD(P)-dependent oxidoreductase, partial [Pseudomonadota bacterium]